MKSHGAHKSEHQAALFSSSSALHRTVSVISVSARPDGSESIFCPGLFAPAIAQDGMLVRVRVPGGTVTSQQALVLAEFAAKLGAVDLQEIGRAHV